MPFGQLSYHTYNIGDNIQSEAAAQLLPTISNHINRDTHEVAHPGPQRVIFNGWFDGRYCKFPPPPDVDALFVSFHINETTLGPEYATYMSPMLNFQPLSTHSEYLNRHAPIGCRDLHTCKLLTDAGV